MQPKSQARELALKALYQAEVGQTPISQALEGALDQIRSQHLTAVDQLEREAERDIRTTIAGDAAEASSTSKRQITAVVRATIEEVKAHGDRLREITGALLNETRQLDTGIAAERAAESTAQAESKLTAIAARPGFYPDLFEKVAAMAIARTMTMKEQFLKRLDTSDQIAAYLVNLVHGALASRAEIDARVSALSRDWSLDRQPAVDRNILRIAAYEIMHKQAPVAVAIDEAVNLAKKYSTEESGKFVNGVLGALANPAEVKA